MCFSPPPPDGLGRGTEDGHGRPRDEKEVRPTVDKDGVTEGERRVDGVERTVRPEERL